MCVLTENGPYLGNNQRYGQKRTPCQMRWKLLTLNDLKGHCQSIRSAILAIAVLIRTHWTQWHHRCTEKHCRGRQQTVQYLPSTDSSVYFQSTIQRTRQLFCDCFFVHDYNVRRVNDI